MSFVKIQANQATISASQNLMDFEVPEYIQGIDLDESFININYRIESTETTPGSGTGIHNYVKLFNGIGVVNTATKAGSASLFNSSLVRNIVLSASKGGQLESIQRADLYAQVKQQFTKNVGDIQGEGGHSLRSLPEQYNYPMDQSRNLLTEGTVKSTEKVGVMRIPLKDVLGLGSATLNLNQLGALRIHLEANLNKFTLKEVPTWNGSAIKGSFNNYWKQDITIAVGGASPTSIVLSNESTAQGPFAFITKKNAPFWVGQKVSFVLNGGATNTVNEVVISSIVWNATDAVATGAHTPAGLQATISFEGDAAIFQGVVAGAGVTSINMFPVYASSATLEYTGAEMVCKTVVNPPQALGIQYRTIHTIQDFAPASTSMNRTYEVPRDAIASLVCFDTATSSTEFSNSFEPNLTSYQAYVDNVGITDRPVKIKGTAPFTKDPLHGIILEKTLEEMGLEYKNNLDVLPKMLNMNIGASINNSSVISAGGVFTAQEGTSGVTVIPLIYEQTGVAKLINLDLQRSATVPGAVGSMNLVMFQQVQRVINY